MDMYTSTIHLFMFHPDHDSFVHGKRMYGTTACPCSTQTHADTYSSHNSFVHGLTETQFICSWGHTYGTPVCITYYTCKCMHQARYSPHSQLYPYTYTYLHTYIPTYTYTNSIYPTISTRTHICKQMHPHRHT